MGWKFPELTRRSFLQTSGLAATGAAMTTPLEWFSTAEAARQPSTRQQ
ncbi:MAG: twin-arginine translocation signal domain-containing protein [Magnetococcales bacterium]|nr:twin-arginine translocation signal domain-containing protein [Magnetococcales bacterium]